MYFGLIEYSAGFEDYRTGTPGDYGWKVLSSDDPEETLQDLNNLFLHLFFGFAHLSFSQLNSFWGPRVGMLICGLPVGCTFLSGFEGEAPQAERRFGQWPACHGGHNGHLVSKWGCRHHRPRDVASRDLRQRNVEPKCRAMFTVVSFWKVDPFLGSMLVCSQYMWLRTESNQKALCMPFGVEQGGSEQASYHLLQRDDTL